jgi:hypothetical protein
MSNSIDVLTQIIREVDGDHSLSAGTLAESILRHKDFNLIEGRGLEDQLEIAKKIALGIHIDDKYGFHPYSYHLEQVVSYIEEFFVFTKDSNLIKLKIIAWLHDTIEDHPDKINRQYLLDKGFQEDIVDAVEAISKNKNEKLSDYLKRVKANQFATKVKIADSYANISQDDTNLHRIKKYSYCLNFLTRDLNV